MTGDKFAPYTKKYSIWNGQWLKEVTNELKACKICGFD